MQNYMQDGSAAQMRHGGEPISQHQFGQATRQAAPRAVGALPSGLPQNHQSEQDYFEQQQRRMVEQLQATANHQYGSNFSAVSNVQDEIQDQPLSSSYPTEALQYQNQSSQPPQQHLRGRDFGIVSQDATPYGMATPLQIEHARQRPAIGNMVGGDEIRNGAEDRRDGRARDERAAQQQNQPAVNESHASSKIAPASQNQNLGAKRGDDEIEPLGSDEGDNHKSRSRDNRQRSQGQSKQPSISNPPEKQPQRMPLKSAQGFTKQKYDMKSARELPKKGQVAPADQLLAPHNDFEEYFKSLLDQVNNKKTKSNRSLWPSKSTQHLRSTNPAAVAAKRSLIQLQPVQVKGGAKDQNPQPVDKKPKSRQKSATNGAKRNSSGGAGARRQSTAGRASNPSQGWQQREGGNANAVIADDDTEVYTERSMSNNTPVRLQTQKSVDGGGDAGRSRSSFKQERAQKNPNLQSTQVTQSFKPLQERKPVKKHHKSVNAAGRRRGSQLSHRANKNGPTPTLVSQRSTEKGATRPADEAPSKPQKSQPKFSAAKQHEFMSRQMSYKIKKDSRMNELVQKKQLQEVEGCTFQPKITSRRKQAAHAHDPNFALDDLKRRDDILENHANSQEEKAAIATSTLIHDDTLDESNRPLPHAVNGAQDGGQGDLEEQGEGNAARRKQRVRQVKIEIGRNQDNEVTARLSKSSTGAKHRSKDQFLKDQKMHAMKREQRLAELKEKERQKQKVTMTFQPQIDKVSRVLGELQIQQKYSHKEYKPIKEQLDHNRVEEMKRKVVEMDDADGEDAFDVLAGNQEALDGHDQQLQSHHVIETTGIAMKIHDRLYSEAKERSVKRNQLVYDTMKQRSTTALGPSLSHPALLSTSKHSFTTHGAATPLDRRLPTESLNPDVTTAAAVHHPTMMAGLSASQLTNLNIVNAQIHQIEGRSEDAQSRGSKEVRRNRGFQMRGQRPGTSRSNQRSTYSVTNSKSRAQQSALATFLSQPKNSVSHQTYRQPKQRKVQGPKLNNKSKLYFIQKFTKEIIKVWQEIPTITDEQMALLKAQSLQKATSRSNHFNNHLTSGSQESLINQNYVVSNPADTSTEQAKSPRQAAEGQFDMKYIQPNDDQQKLSVMTFDKNGSQQEIGQKLETPRLTESARQNETMDFEVMRFVLQKLGFAKEYKTKGAAAQHLDSLFAPHASVRSLSQPYTQANTASLSQRAAQQDDLLKQMWMVLGGPYYSHVTLNNLRMLLLAVKGFRVQPDIALNGEGDGEHLGGELIRMQDVLGPRSSAVAASAGMHQQNESTAVQQFKEDYNSHASFSPTLQKINNNGGINNAGTTHLAIPPRDSAFAAARPVLDLNVGVFNKNGDFYLNKQDVEAAAKYFSALNQERQLFEHQQLLIRKEERANAVPHTFRPFVDPKNNLLAERSRERHDDMERAFSGTRKPNQGALDTPGQGLGVEKRCVSPIVERLARPPVSPRWLALQKLKLQDAEQQECTFKPQINPPSYLSRAKDKPSQLLKSSNQKINNGINMIVGSNPNTQGAKKGSGLQDRKPGELSLMGANKKVSPLNLERVMKNQDPMKYKSKDLMEETGDKFNDLYVLSKKIDFLKPKRDKSTEDLEFEKAKDECTFKPKIGKKSRQPKNQQEVSQGATTPMPAHLLSTQQSVVLNQSIRNSNEFGEMGPAAVRNQPLTAKASTMPNMKLLRTSQFGTTDEGQMPESDNMKKIRGAEEAIDRVNQTNHEKAVLAKLQDLGLMLNERNVRKVEAILQQEEEQRRLKVKEAEAHKKSKVGSMSRSHVGSQRQSVSQRSKHAQELNQFDPEYPDQHALQEPDGKEHRYSYHDDSQGIESHGNQIAVEINAPPIPSDSPIKQLSRNEEGLYGPAEVVPQRNEFRYPSRDGDRFKSRTLSSTGKIKPQLQSVRELGGEDNEATIEEEPDASKDLINQAKHNDTVDTVKNIESPQKTVNMMTTDSQSLEKTNRNNGAQMGQRVGDAHASQAHQVPAHRSPDLSTPPPPRQALGGAMASPAQASNHRSGRRSSSRESSSSSLPLLEVDINITPTHTERIQIFSDDVIEGDDGIAKRFCREHGLGDGMEKQLVKVLTEQVKEAKEQLEEQEEADEI